MKKIYLHIGLHKTGSSTLQAFLQKNSNLLRDIGYLYPRTGTSSKFPCHHNLAWLIMDFPKADPDAGTWKELHQEIGKTTSDKIVISSEEFEFFRQKHIDLLKSELEPYKVKIVVYIRRQDQRLESQYTHLTKTGLYSGDISSFCQQKRNASDYYRILTSWKAAFGLENIIVRPLEKTQIPNICYDFLNVIGIDDYRDFIEVENKNIRPGIKKLKILRIANQIYEKYPRKRKIYLKHIKRIMDANKSRITEEKSYRLLTYLDSVKILNWYKESNVKIAREYLHRPDGILFKEQLEKYKSTKFNLEDFSKDELLEIIRTIIETEKKDNGKNII